MKILIISPQNWGKMRISKHHYAIELALLGHQVFYLEPLVASWKMSKRRIESRESGSENLKLISHEINFPYNLKFHFPTMYRVLMKKHVKELDYQLGPFDIIWSFDIANSIPISLFSQKSKKIFFAADWPPNERAKSACHGADLIVSVAQEILEEYQDEHSNTSLLIPHGVANCFIEASKRPFSPQSDTIHIGMSGNFLRPDINRQALLEIINAHRKLQFNLFGAYKDEDSNLGGEKNDDTNRFINSLMCASNVNLKGVLTPEALALELRKMDAFLICYDESKDQSKATNYHKISEYLAYGQFIVSNRVSAHNSNPLVLQDENADGHVDVTANFKKFISNYSRGISTASEKQPVSYKENLALILGSI